MNQHALLTYGYGRHPHLERPGRVEDLEEYVVAGAVIMDVRFSPNSRDLKWKKEHLEAVLGDEYEWVHALGNRNYNSQGSPILIVDLRAGLARLRDRLEQSPVVLLCGCGNVRTCHRRLVAEEAQKALGCSVHHLKPGETLNGLRIGAEGS